MRPQRRRQLEQWLGPYLSDRGGSQTDRRGLNLRSRVEKNGTVLTLIPGKEIGPKSDDDIRSFSGRETPKFVLFFCVQQHLKSCLYDAPFGPQRSTQQCVASLLEKYNSVCPTLQFRSDSKRPLSVSACRILSTILSSCTSLLQRQM